MMRVLSLFGLTAVVIGATAATKTVTTLGAGFPIAGTSCTVAACKAHVLVPAVTKTVPTAASASCPKNDWPRFAAPINIGDLPTPPPLPLGVGNFDAQAPIQIETHATQSGSEILMTVSHCSTVAGRTIVTTQIMHVPLAKGAKVTVDTYRAALPKR